MLIQLVGSVGVQPATPQPPVQPLGQRQPVGQQRLSDAQQANMAAGTASSTHSPLGPEERVTKRGRPAEQKGVSKLPKLKAAPARKRKRRESEAAEWTGPTLLNWTGAQKEYFMRIVGARICSVAGRWSRRTY